MATDTTRPDNRLLISVWIMFAICLGIYFEAHEVANDFMDGLFWTTRAERQERKDSAEAAVRAYDQRVRAQLSAIRD